MPRKAKVIPVKRDLSHSSSDRCSIGGYCSDGTRVRPSPTPIMARTSARFTNPQPNQGYQSLAQQALARKAAARAKQKASPVRQRTKSSSASAKSKPKAKSSSASAKPMPKTQSSRARQPTSSSSSASAKPMPKTNMAYDPLSEAAIMQGHGVAKDTPDAQHMGLKIRVADLDPVTRRLMFYKHVVIPHIYLAKQQSGMTIPERYFKYYPFDKVAPAIQLVIYDHDTGDVVGVQATIKGDAVYRQEASRVRLDDFVNSP